MISRILSGIRTVPTNARDLHIMVNHYNDTTLLNCSQIGQLLHQPLHSDQDDSLSNGMLMLYVLS